MEFDTAVDEIFEEGTVATLVLPENWGKKTEAELRTIIDEARGRFDEITARLNESPMEGPKLIALCNQGQAAKRLLAAQSLYA